MKKAGENRYTPPCGDLATERFRLSPRGGKRALPEDAFGPLRLCGLTARPPAAHARGRYLSIEAREGGLAKAKAPLGEALLSAFRFFLGTSPLRLLVAGLGNRHLTADALGPLTADGVEATAAIPAEALAAAGLRLSRVFVFVPDVLARTGIESARQIAAAAAVTKAEAVLTVDALASAERERLLSVIELTDAGTVPGGGVGARRLPVTREALGIPVLSLGVPTVVRAGEGYFTVTRTLEEDTAVLARVIAEAINRFARGERPQKEAPISHLFLKKEKDP